MHNDVLVVGGGPAGAAAARLLALWGHRVHLSTRPEATAASLAESLPPSCGKLFDLLGVRDAIDDAGFVRCTGNTVWWGSDVPRIESFAGGLCGWQVCRERLASTLLTAAREAGVTVERARVSSDSIDAATERVVLDCSGRAGVVARARDWRVYEPALRTVALVGAWRRPDAWPLPDPSHTLIESYADGWAWSVPLAEGTRHVAVMVDPRSTDLAKALPARDVYLAEIAKTRELAALTRDAGLEGGPWGWDASMYSSTCYADQRVLLVGDAGSFIDPLSSAGVKKALASGWLAAVAAHTALIHPEMRQTAFEFFAARERDVYERFRELTERFLADAAAGRSHPFWNDRADLAADRTPRPAAQAVFEALRTAPSIALRPGPDVTVAKRPGVSGCEIVLEPRLVSSRKPEGARYSFDVDLVALIELAPRFEQVPDLFDGYCRRNAPVALPDFLLALASAIADGWLVNDQSA